jgi:hypothetical protein
MIGLEECGEIDPENFYSGRFNKCKKCRNQMVKDYIKDKKEMTKDEELENQTEKIKDGKLIQDLITKMIINARLMEESLTISESFHYLKTSILDYHKSHYKDMEKIGENFRLLNVDNEQLRRDNARMKKNLSRINNFLEEKFNLNFDDI